MKICAYTLAVLSRDIRSKPPAGVIALKFRLSPGLRKQLIRQMKLITVLLIMALVQAGATGYSQQVTLREKNASVEAVFHAIEKQTGYVFFYDHADLQHQKISINLKNVTLEEALDRCFAKLPLTYKIIGTTIAIKRKERVTPNKDQPGTSSLKIVSPTTSPASAPLSFLHREMTTLPKPVVQRIVGKVNDENGDPLPGVSILIKGTQQGTTTDGEGRFQIEVSNENAVLVFSFVGYVSQEVVVGSRSTLDISLEIDEKSLEEVVVVGYGVVRKSDLTGSVARVGEEDIKSTPVVSLDRALQGRAAGVMVTASSGAPGASNTIRIRGTGSVNAGNDPLYVIDGFPTGNLNTINPNDIESIEILKDASATAIYGSRGSNGVVIVTTKRGKEGQSNIGFESYYGVQKVRRKIPLLNASEYAAFINEARKNAGAAPYFDGSSPQRPLPETLGEGTDWQDRVLQSAPIQNYQLTFSGGESKTKYSISGNYFHQDGIVLNSFFKRFTVRANIDREVRSWLKIGLSSQAAHSRSSSSFTPAQGGLGGGVINAALNYSPVFPVLGEDGAYYRDFSSLNGNLVDNPVALANERKEYYNTIRLLNNVFAEIHFTRHLIFRSSFGADLFHGKNNVYSTRLIELGAGSNGVASVSASQNLNWLNENTLNYTQTFNNRLNVNALIGYTTQSYLNEGVTANAANFNNDFALYHNLGSGATLRSPRVPQQVSGR